MDDSEVETIVKIEWCRRRGEGRATFTLYPSGHVNLDNSSLGDRLPWRKGWNVVLTKDRAPYQKIFDLAKDAILSGAASASGDAESGETIFEKMMSSDVTVVVETTKTSYVSYEDILKLGEGTSLASRHWPIRGPEKCSREWGAMKSSPIINSKIKR